MRPECGGQLCWAPFVPRSSGVRPIVVGSCVGHPLHVEGTTCFTEQWGKTDCGENVCLAPFGPRNGGVRTACGGKFC